MNNEHDPIWVSVIIFAMCCACGDAVAGILSVTVAWLVVGLIFGVPLAVINLRNLYRRMEIDQRILEMRRERIELLRCRRDERNALRLMRKAIEAAQPDEELIESTGIDDESILGIFNQEEAQCELSEN